MTQDKNKQFRVELDHENKVIRFGAYFYPLKGVLICEATEEDKKKYHCDRFMTFPIVGENWEVREDDEIANGIDLLLIGKKGETILLDDLFQALDYNAKNNCCAYDEVLSDVERNGICVSNRKRLDSEELLSDTLVLEINKVSDRQFQIGSYMGNYYIPTRWCYIGDDDELYLCTERGEKRENYTKTKVVDLIAEDVCGIAWFFNRPNIRVFATARLSYMDNTLKEIPTDWFYTVQTIDNDINRRIEELQVDWLNDYNKSKLPDKTLKED